jgi:hypothetical protein
MRKNDLLLVPNEGENRSVGEQVAIFIKIRRDLSTLHNRDLVVVELQFHFELVEKQSE